MKRSQNVTLCSTPTMERTLLCSSSCCSAMLLQELSMHLCHCLCCVLVSLPSWSNWNWERCYYRVSLPSTANRSVPNTSLLLLRISVPVHGGWRAQLWSTHLVFDLKISMWSKILLRQRWPSQAAKQPEKNLVAQGQQTVPSRQQIFSCVDSQDIVFPNWKKSSSSWYFNLFGSACVFDPRPFP